MYDLEDKGRGCCRLSRVQNRVYQDFHCLKTLQPVKWLRHAFERAYQFRFLSMTLIDSLLTILLLYYVYTNVVI